MSNADQLNRQSIIENQGRGNVRIDLHVHSRFSSRPYSWFLRSAHSAECYTDPATVYKTAKLRGMNLVTLSDHDTIDGALELAAMGPDTFISEEVSARFPEDGCIVHTIALDITEEQHREIQRLRVNVYELVSYLHHQGVEFFLCHPLSEVNRRLQTSHLERCLLMFRNLEIRNGTRDAVHEECLRQVLSGLTPAVIARYAQKHPGTPVLNPEGRYGLVGGSDDHAGLSIARASTTFTGERSGPGVPGALRERRTAAGGSPGTAIVLEHNVYGVLGGYFAHSGELGEAKPDGSPSSLNATLEYYGARLAEAQEREEKDEADWEAAERHEHAHARKAAGFGAPEPANDVTPPEMPPQSALASLPARGHTDQTQAHLSRLLESVLVTTGRDAFGPFIQALSTMRPIELADSLPALVKNIVAAMPALLGARWHAHDILSARRYGAGLGLETPALASPRVAVLTDTVDDVNGVALGLRRLREAATAAGHDLRLRCTWGEGDHLSIDEDGTVRVPALARHRLADYPEMEFGLPHLPSLLNYLIANRIDLVQCIDAGAGRHHGVVRGAPGRDSGRGSVPHRLAVEYCTRITGDPMTGAILVSHGRSAGSMARWIASSCPRKRLRRASPSSASPPRRSRACRGGSTSSSFARPAEIRTRSLPSGSTGSPRCSTSGASRARRASTRSSTPSRARVAIGARRLGW